MLESTFPEYDLLGEVRGPTGTGLPGVAPSNLFRARDDRYVIIAANHDSLFARLSAAMKRLELAEDPRYATHQAGMAPKFSDTPGAVRWSGPWEPGTDAQTFRNLLGLSEDQIEALRSTGVI